MEATLLDWIKKVQTNKIILSLEDEAKTSQSVILPILQYLGWEIFDSNEVCPQFSIKSKKVESTIKKVDYALRYQDQNKVFIEVKKVGIDLETGDHQRQLLDYSFQEGVELAVLTNGISWWLYLPLRIGGWEQRKFFTIELIDQDPKEIAQKFTDFLSKEKVVSGKALEKAKKLFNSNQKELLIKQNLPKAWNKILGESNEILIDLIADTTEKLCGYKPDDEVVEQFIASYAHQIEYPSISKPTIYRPKIVNPPPSSSSLKNNNGSNVTYKQISSFKFLEKQHDTKTWKGLLMQITNLMLALHPDQFSKVLTLSGRKPYFSKIPEELRYPENIESTPIFIETNMSATQKMKLSYTIIKLFGYSENDLVVAYQ
jgi:hypothetical protein